MRPFLLCACVLAVVAAPAAAQTDALQRARTLYNQRKFDAAVQAADEAGSVPARADSADLVAARAYLEKFRESAVPDDLMSAGQRLRRISADRLEPSERTELVIGLGVDLYLDQSAGAAAELFDSLLAIAPGAANAPGPEARERVLDWWASALDKVARPLKNAEGQAIYQRIRDRMRDELGATPTSAAASYWLAATSLAQGDASAAWDAALAGWVRAPLAADKGAGLRGDLDALVLRSIIPERARLLGQSEDAGKTDWETFKSKWEK